VEEKRRWIDAELERLETTMINPTPDARRSCERAGISAPSAPTSLATLLRRPDVDYRALSKLGVAFADVPSDWRETVESEIKYRGYLKRESVRVAETARWEEAAIPASIAFDAITGLSREVREKLVQIRPTSVAQAQRIPGMTPAALNLLLVHVRRASNGPLLGA
jgi:tRNA uridine 5-carboxymethylaminomethyl modification enzyme